MHSSDKGINFEAGMTVQVLALHPYQPNIIRWAHNLLEDKPSDIPRYEGKGKPSGWGNAGGGLEKRLYNPILNRHFEGELDYLSFRYPHHPLLMDGSLSEEDKTVLACGLREFVDETGYVDIDIITEYRNEYDRPFLLDYLYKDNDHRVVTIWGQLRSFKVQNIVESYEIDRTDWFDTSSSLFKQFFNRLTHPDRPYWSHVRRTLLALLRINRHQRQDHDNHNDFIRLIHPSWWTVFQVGRGDPRFPVRGYKISPADWYKLFDYAVENRIDMPDQEYIYRLFRNEIEEQKRLEELEFEKEEVEEVAETIPAPDLAESVDSTSYPTPQEIASKEDEEYCMWLEAELNLPDSLRVVSQRPVA